tara:strand:- start:9734 stop:9928 length:195 start_codon:yes stop_codon:yes gene_type:complete
MSDYPDRKEKYRIFWMVKGHFNCSEEVIFSCFDSYFKRLWSNGDTGYREEGFEEAWRKLTSEKV